MHNATFFTFLHHFGVKIELYGLFDYAFFVIEAKNRHLQKTSVITSIARSISSGGQKDESLK